MEVIPVLDIKGGIVVRASGGVRSAYAPITTPLATSSDPVVVLAGIQRVSDTRTVYIADLDAIEGRDRQTAAIDRLYEAFPDTAFWIDPGIDAAGATNWLAACPHTLVLGSESQQEASPVGDLRANRRVVLSLDFRDGFIGPAGLIADPSLWPARVIVMTLSRVGASAGPDFDRLQEIRDRSPHTATYAAGGVRDDADIAALQAMGVGGALVSTGLHQGTITAAALQAVTRGRREPATE